MTVRSFLSVNGIIWFIGAHPEIMAVIMIAILFMSSLMGKQGNRKLIFIYLAGIVYITILSRPVEGRRAILTPFWSYRYFLTDLYFRRQILNNICLFIPLGMILSQLRPRWTSIGLLFIISAGIEIIQFVSRRGFCEFDDVFSNTLGGAAGFILGMLLICCKKLFSTKTGSCTIKEKE